MMVLFVSFKVYFIFCNEMVAKDFSLMSKIKVK